MNRPYAGFTPAELCDALKAINRAHADHQAWADAAARRWWREREAALLATREAIMAELDIQAAGDDPRLTQYAAERAELERAIEKAVLGQYIGKPPPMLTGWTERAVASVVSAGWLPPGAVAERLASEGHCCERPGG